MDEQIMNNEVIEETNNVEVIDNYEVQPTMPEVYVPDTTETAESSGPNKALIALAIGGGLLVAKPAIRKAKSLIARHKEKKEARETERIMSVLTKTGLIQQPADVKPADVTEVKAEEVVPDAKPEEKTEEVKTETK